MSAAIHPFHLAIPAADLADLADLRTRLAHTAGRTRKPSPTPARACNRPGCARWPRAGNTAATGAAARRNA